MRHHTNLSNLTPVEIIFAIAALFLILYIYFLPTITAIKRNSPHKTAVVIVNIFFGVTLIGWLVALLLATKQPQQVVVVYNTPPPPR
ncbi:MAG TPA: superinfection immunity protein [Candidatus Angelobacter sp.]